MLERATSRISVEKFLSGSIEKFASGTFLCFTNFLVSKKFMDKRGGRREVVSRVSINFFCLSAEKNRRGTL